MVRIVQPQKHSENRTAETFRVWISHGQRGHSRGYFRRGIFGGSVLQLYCVRSTQYDRLFFSFFTLLSFLEVAVTISSTQTHSKRRYIIEDSRS